MINIGQKGLIPAMETVPPAKWSRLVINGIFCLSNYNSDIQIIYPSHYLSQHETYDQVVSKVRPSEIIDLCKESQCSLLFRLALKRSKAYSSDFYYFGLTIRWGRIFQNILHVCYFYWRELYSTWSCNC